MVLARLELLSSNFSVELSVTRYIVILLSCAADWIAKKTNSEIYAKV
jgi:hypothetical protein